MSHSFRDGLEYGRMLWNINRVCKYELQPPTRAASVPSKLCADWRKDCATQEECTVTHCGKEAVAVTLIEKSSCTQCEVWASIIKTDL
jgi:hypothetical protein